MILYNRAENKINEPSSHVVCIVWSGRTFDTNRRFATKVYTRVDIYCYGWLYYGYTPGKDTASLMSFGIITSHCWSKWPRSASLFRRSVTRLYWELMLRPIHYGWLRNDVNGPRHTRKPVTSIKRVTADHRRREGFIFYTNDDNIIQGAFNIMLYYNVYMLIVRICTILNESRYRCARCMSKIRWKILFPTKDECNCI